ncbi:unnamed protein product [Protopolystoma xenopodis]|uniref:Uncharacterized protein n=1 Tax=Protopolystoma xenopodis TaxID=117903 RepID=A0A448XSD7_9PLAT|nr:unnamed protein product [Protopolystoma xenopodis]
MATEKPTKTPVVTGWEIRRPDGGLLNLGLLAESVRRSGDLLHLNRLARLPYYLVGTEGRCLVNHGRQVYYSAYFPIQIEAKEPSKQVEGEFNSCVLADLSKIF